MGLAQYLADFIRRSEDPFIEGINRALDRRWLNAHMPRAEGPDCGDAGGYPYGSLPPPPKLEEIAGYIC